MANNCLNFLLIKLKIIIKNVVIIIYLLTFKVIKTNNIFNYFILI